MFINIELFVTTILYHVLKVICLVCLPVNVKWTKDK